MKNLLTTTICFLIATFVMAQEESLFNDDQLHEIRFTLVDTSIFIGSKDYQMVNINIDGTTIDSIGFKKKGNLSASHPNHKFPFKIKTNKYVNGKKYDGIKEFTLHNNFQDPSLLREKFTYDIMESIGLHALQTAFAKVYINEQYWGVYTLVEAKDELYKREFDNNDGAVLESTDFGDMCYRGPQAEDYYEDFFEDYIYQLDNGEFETAWSHFPTMLDKANNTPSSTYMEIVPEHLNIEDFVKYQAANVYLLNMDSYLAFRGNQLYYFDENTNVWEVIPWDFNASFSLWDTNNQTITDYGLFPSAITNGCIAEHIEQVPALKTIYLNTICSLFNGELHKDNLIAAIDKWHTQIKEAVYSDTRKAFTNDQFDQANEYGYNSFESLDVPNMKTFATERWNFIHQQLMALNYDCGSVNTAMPSNNNDLFQVWPNPSSDKIHLLIPEGEWQIDIYNINGQVVPSQMTDGSINISQLPQGYYTIQFFNSVHTYNRSFIKQ